MDVNRFSGDDFRYLTTQECEMMFTNFERLFSYINGRGIGACVSGAGRGSGNGVAVIINF